MRNPAARVPGIAAALAAAVLTVFAPPARAGIHHEVLPNPKVIANGATFDLELTVAAGSDSFNAYEDTLSYDTSVLQFIQLSPLSLQEGDLMKTACVNRWHLFNENAGVITISHALLCAGKRVAGPGTVYRLRFQAIAPDVETWVRFTGSRFADQGIPIQGVTTADGLVVVGNPTTGIPGNGDPAGLALGAFPSPFRERVTLVLDLEEAGPVRIDVLDVLGRRVARILDEALPPGRRTFTWDGRDAAGSRAGDGMYLLRAETSAGRTTRKVVLRR